MRTAIFFLVFAGTYFQAQNFHDKEVLKKYRKEFSKKICLSDEDHDGTSFYPDACPKKFSSSQNNGCPVQATPRKDSTEVSELENVIYLTFPKIRLERGCGQIIKEDLLKPTTK